MILNGEPFVPPTCPAEREGDIFPITPDKFGLYHTDLHPQNIPAITGVFIHADEDTDNLEIVGAGYAELAADSDLLDAVKLRNISARAGELICERIKNCRGITSEGECYALGSRAILEVTNQITEEKF